ncbi:MAG: hypothetical protein P1U36_00620 [Legionellaceae bacterium]|nr:hypothetical protein [Legionellaceae bacterium]
MPLFFYSQLKTTVYNQKELDKMKINQSVEEPHVVMNAEELKKLAAFQASIEELYHLFNQDYDRPADDLNEILHGLSLQANKKIADTQDMNDGLEPGYLRKLNNTLSHHKTTNHLMLQSIGEGVFATLALAVAVISIAAIPLSIAAGALPTAVSGVVMALAAGYTSLIFGELSYHTYKLSQDQQLNHINNFFSSSDSLEKIEQEQSNTSVDPSSLLSSTMQY